MKKETHTFGGVTLYSGTRNIRRIKTPEYPHQTDFPYSQASTVVLELERMVQDLKQAMACAEREENEQRTFGDYQVQKSERGDWMIWHNDEGELSSTEARDLARDMRFQADLICQAADMTDKLNGV